MAKKSMQEKFIAALTARGETQVKITHKYRVYTRGAVITPADQTFYYIGASGALRFGHTVSGSVPVSDELKRQLLAEGA